MAVRFIGANPCLTVLRDGERVAFASVWRADWSELGSGHAIVLWHEGQTRVVATDAALGRWLAADFTRHFPEVKGLPWPEPEVETALVHLELELAHGLHAEGGGIAVDISGPKDRQLFTTDDFYLGGVRHTLSTVFMPCETGSLRIDHDPVEGEVKAFLADAEVWLRE